MILILTDGTVKQVFLQLKALRYTNESTVKYEFLKAEDNVKQSYGPLP